MRRTNVAAFQQLWFNIASAQLGFTGAAKWDLYWGRYDFRREQPVVLDDQPDPRRLGAVPRPTTRSGCCSRRPSVAGRSSASSRGPRTIGIRPAGQPEKELAAYVGPGRKR